MPILRPLLRTVFPSASSFTRVMPARRMSTSSGLKHAGPVSWASLGLVGVIGSGLVYFYQQEKERQITQSTQKIKTTGKPLLGGPWTLVDSSTRQAVTDASLHGRYTLLYFGFTHCPDICPNELVRLGKVIDAVGEKVVQPVFISVDPRRDTVVQMEGYKQDFHPSLRMLTGTTDQIAQITKAYRVYFNKVDEDEEVEDDYLVDHSIVMYLLNPRGEFVDFFTQSAQVPDMIKRIEKAIAADE